MRRAAQGEVPAREARLSGEALRGADLRHLFKDRPVEIRIDAPRPAGVLAGKPFRITRWSSTWIVPRLTFLTGAMRTRAVLEC